MSTDHSGFADPGPQSAGQFTLWQCAAQLYASGASVRQICSVPNVSSQIGIYVDEANEIFRHAQGLQMFDLDHVEVLKGPQGTLFGRNTTGGRHFILHQAAVTDRRSKRPVSPQDMAISTVMKWRLPPMSHSYRTNSAFGAAFTRTFGDGGIKNATGGPAFGSVDNIQARLILRAKPSPDLKYLLVAHLFQRRPHPQFDSCRWI